MNDSDKKNISDKKILTETSTEEIKLVTLEKSEFENRRINNFLGTLSDFCSIKILLKEQNQRLFKLTAI